MRHLPLGLKARRHDVRMVVSDHRWQRELGTLVCTTVAETEALDELVSDRPTVLTGRPVATTACPGDHLTE
jgi:hypothetical protein